jgi:hypothetical protein|nr:MAG TPA: hypothetical protein [Caudoviricetes sp.]
MSYTRLELQAVIKGLEYRRVDFRSELASLAANLRVALNKKRLKINDLFNQKKEERTIEKAFNVESVQEDAHLFAENVRELNEYFKHRR